MKLVALDVGKVRIGLAVGQLGSSLVFGRGVIVRSSQAKDVAAVAALQQREGAEHVVLGMPARTQGGQSKQGQRVQAFAHALNQAGIATVFEDERFTSQLAKQHMLASGISKQKRREKGRVDEGAAILILQSYLARQAAETAPCMLD